MKVVFTGNIDVLNESLYDSGDDDILSADPGRLGRRVPERGR